MTLRNSQRNTVNNDKKHNQENYEKDFSIIYSGIRRQSVFASTKPR